LAKWQAREPPLEDGRDAHVGGGVAAQLDWATDWDGAAQTASNFELDQRING